MSDDDAIRDALRHIVRSRRFRLRTWKQRQSWIPQRRMSGVSVRRHIWWRWLGRDWLTHFTEDEASFQARKQRYEEWKRRHNAGGAA